MILKTTFYAPVIALREINPASSTLFPVASRAPPASVMDHRRNVAPASNNKGFDKFPLAIFERDYRGLAQIGTITGQERGIVAGCRRYMPLRTIGSQRNESARFRLHYRHSPRVIERTDEDVRGDHGYSSAFDNFPDLSGKHVYFEGLCDHLHSLVQVSIPDHGILRIAGDE
jgi:hypothetical protein